MPVAEHGWPHSLPARGARVLLCTLPAPLGVLYSVLLGSGAFSCPLGTAVCPLARIMASLQSPGKGVPAHLEMLSEASMPPLQVWGLQSSGWEDPSGCPGPVPGLHLPADPSDTHLPEVLCGRLPGWVPFLSVILGMCLSVSDFLRSPCCGSDAGPLE